MQLIEKCVCLFLFCSISFACTHDKQSSSDPVKIIPQPLLVDAKKGAFEWNEHSQIVITADNNELKKIANTLSSLIGDATGNSVNEITISDINRENAIILCLDKDMKSGEEGYELTIDNKRIVIKALKPAGLFYGVQTLLQILPSEIFKKNGLSDGFRLNATHITDHPRFSYRGMHLDVARTFFTKEEVKKYIDLMAMYKFNRFHWHLTDGAGWRIEIKKYPLLTQKTAFRPDETWKKFWNGDRKFVDEGTLNAYGGYYTQEDIKEIVAYAADRYITIIPEIEMPGHSEEVFVAYPQLSCSGKPYVDGDFCAGNDESFAFIEDVLTEVMELFPSPYIHIGGDEATKSAWKKCPKCQQRIKSEELKDVNGLQSYFVKRVSDFLTAKGRKLIGWDEIIDGGLANHATVMLWRDPQTAVQVARQGNDVIMAPNAYCYLDYYQTNPVNEPEAIGGYLTLSKVYSFEVVQNDSLASHFLGGQANIWTEYVPNFKHVEYMVFPRSLAMAEALWSSKKNRNWEHFKMKMENQYPRLDYLDVNYKKPSAEVEIFEKTDTVNKRLGIYFDTEFYKPEIRYTTDGTRPTKESTLYEDTFFVDGTHTISAAIFVEGQLQEPCYSRVESYHLAIGKKVVYHKLWTAYPAGGETALVDGYRGGYGYGDKRWQGFTNNLDVTIDLGATTNVKTFNANFMQLIGPGVFMPEYVEVSVSTDGQHFEKVLRVDNDIPKTQEGLQFKDFAGSLGGKDARYLKVFGRNTSEFIFVDEIVIN